METFCLFFAKVYIYISSKGTLYKINSWSLFHIEKRFSLVIDHGFSLWRDNRLYNLIYTFPVLIHCKSFYLHSYLILGIQWMSFKSRLNERQDYTKRYEEIEVIKYGLKTLILFLLKIAASILFDDISYDHILCVI